ncbi:MAG: hypothetical protein WBH99_08490 [Azovibrio sp.]|uniref:hypothetical protein n=1 Tax=Azovibrio sp. TaxID=1872673 RepID=UPI003C72297F
MRRDLIHEPGGRHRHLAVERGLGRVIGRLDFLAHIFLALIFLAHIVADENGRAVRRAPHALAASFCLPVGLLK